MLYAVTIALSAFLLFLVQPIIAKQILPWFGGAAGVWTTCMVFFQAVLLAGYAYADAVTRRLSMRRQAAVHVALLAASVFVLPIVAPASLKPAGDTEPWSRILLLLGVTIGLPYFLLSTTGPLVQAWAARRHVGDRVYRLYAVSNAASMAALVAYPMIVEPFVSTRAQAWSWSVAYACYAALAAAATWMTVRRIDPHADGSATSAAALEGPGAAPANPRWPLSSALTVFVLAALASVLLLAITAHMTRDVASIPFLWLVPLLLYLLTFVLCFGGAGSYRRAVFVPLTAASVVVMLWVNVYRPLDLRVSLPVHALGLFAACMFCHGEVVLRRPPAALLTRFYFAVSLGGAVGGLLVGVVAPLTLPANLELPFALCFVALAIYRAVDTRLRFVGAVALLFAAPLTTIFLRDLQTNTVAWSRNFYGTLRVLRSTEFEGPDTKLQLTHGVILHGEQYVALERRREPTSYYGPGAGVVRAIDFFRPHPVRVAVIGLGTGTLAAYGQAGDYLKFYELDAEVERYARTHFSFLEDTDAMTEVAIGDARLTLEREPPQGYDVIVVDAFSSDSIPVHLMTREALDTYRRHLKRDGVVVFHVSNRYLDLAPVVRGLADTAGMRAWNVRYEPEDTERWTASDWVLVTANAQLVADSEKQGVGEEVPASSVPTWTDDYSNLFRIVRFRTDTTYR